MIIIAVIGSHSYGGLKTKVLSSSQEEWQLSYEAQ